MVAAWLCGYGAGKHQEARLSMVDNFTGDHARNNRLSGAIHPAILPNKCTPVPDLLLVFRKGYFRLL